MDTLEMVMDREKELRPLYDRMEADARLIYLDPYVPRDKLGREIAGLVKVTLNKPAVFAANIIALLNNAVEQVVVESKRRSFDVVPVEEFHQAIWWQANELLTRRGLATLDSFAVVQACVRGRVAGLCVCHYDAEGRFVPDIVPWDSLYVSYETRRDGLDWASYRMIKSQSLIEEEFGIKIEGREAEVRDVWFDDHSEIWIGKDKVEEQPHNFKQVPVVIETVPLGYGNILLGKDAIRHEGESILFLIRSIIPELNRLATIMQTINMHAAKGAYVFHNETGKTGMPPDYDEFTAPGATTSIGLNEKLDPLLVQDIQRSALQLYQMLDKALAEGSLSSFDLGSFTFEMSGLALIQAQQSKSQISLPRLGTKAAWKNRIARMFTEQVTTMGGSVDVGVEGHEQNFTAESLKGEYTTTYKYFLKSPETDMARASQAQILEKYYDRRTILEKVLEEPDPDEILKQKYADLAEELFPSVLKDRVIRALAELNPWEAKLAAMDAGQTLEQILSGVPQEMPELPSNKIRPALPMPRNPTSGDISQGKKAAIVKATPEKEV